MLVAKRHSPQGSDFIVVDHVDFILAMASDTAAIPLSLYIHYPWCVRKCPYCDFNSHAQRGELPQAQYTDALIQQLGGLLQQYPSTYERTISSIFIGGGTPSLVDPAHIQRLLDAVRTQTRVVDELEVTLEANPGTLDEGHFRGYLNAGINRLSIGVQSFNDRSLQALGRVHDAADAQDAIKLAQDIGFARINVDLMYALPKQSIAMAQADLATALQTQVGHVSLYQLTIEPNTEFAVRPPKVPSSDESWDMQQVLSPMLRKAGYERYEVSAYAQAQQQCQHNLNYWQFGDYLALGAGGHAKLSRPEAGDLHIERYWNKRHPTAYIDAAADGSFMGDQHCVPQQDVLFEFLINALRLKGGFSLQRFTQTTGLRSAALLDVLQPFVQQQWLKVSAQSVQPTERGYRYLDEMLLHLLPPSE